MALDLSLRRWFLFPRLIQTGNEEPRGAHYVGRDHESPLEHKPETGGKDHKSPKDSKPGKYRALDDLTLQEVEEALAFFHPQLVSMDRGDWVAKNYFCTIPLNRSRGERPPVVFGRIQSTFPASGELDNIEVMEMQFPRRDMPPDLLQIEDHDINRRRTVESFYVGVKMFVSRNELPDFQYAEDSFHEKGFAPLYEHGYGELLDIQEDTRPSLPWVYVFGSEWFATVPDSMQPDVKAQIQKLLRWKRAVFNYHPRRYLLQYKSLNDELEFSYGFTEHYLLTPQDTHQVLAKTEETFGEMFMRGMR